MKVPGQGLHLRELRTRSRPGYAAVRNFFAAIVPKRGPALPPDPRNWNDRLSALDERAALGLAGGFRRHRETLALAGVQALAGIRRTLAGALALAGVRGHALALGGGRGRRGRHDGTGKEQRGGGSGQGSTRFGIQLHDVLLDGMLTTKIAP